MCIRDRCEPYLTSDYRLMMEEPEKLVGGLKVILQLFDNAKGVIAVSYTHLDVYKRQVHRLCLPRFMRQLSRLEQALRAQVLTWAVQEMLLPDRMTM